MIDRLLETLSWDGATIKKYRQGGAGQENVLTAEVLSALDFLPREAFLGEVLRCAHGDQSTLALVAAEAEAAEITVLGEDIHLKPSGARHGERMTLQPDAVIEMPGTFVLVEAKRIRKPALFGDDQLAKSLAVAVARAENRRALVLVVMGAPPPIRIRSGGPAVSIEESVRAHLPAISSGSDFDLDDARMIRETDSTMAWVTWSEVRDICVRSLASYDDALPTIRGAVTRLVESIVCAVDRHG